MKYITPNIIVFFTLAILGILVLILIRKIISKKFNSDQEIAIIEITPLAFDDKSVMSNHALFDSLHQLGMHRSLIEKLKGLQNIFSLEISSTKKDGVKFYLTTPKDKFSSVSSLIHAHLPDAKIKLVDDYIKTPNKIIKFKQKFNYVYPLKEFTDLSNVDPVAFIASAMTKLEAHERLTLQIVTLPIDLKETDKIHRRILRNDVILPTENSLISMISKSLAYLVQFIFSLINSVQASGSYNSRSLERDIEYKKQLARGDRPIRSLSAFEQKVLSSVENKLSQSLFKVNIRVLIKSSDKQRIKELSSSIISAINLYSVPKQQALILDKNIWSGRSKVNSKNVSKRLLSGKSSCYLSSSELASLYHFPSSGYSKVDSMSTSLSKSLSAPISLNSGAEFDVLVGENIHHNQVTPIGLTKAERERHMYVIGGTGNGKTTLLKYQIVQDIKNGNGVAVIDPHGDLAEELLGYIPKERINDVVYINPDDLYFPVGINLLELPPNITGNDLEREKDRVTESVISVFRKIFSEDDSGGHRIEYILRNAIQTALTLEGSTIFTIFQLLNDPFYQREVRNNLEDKNLKNFWKNEIGKAGDFQRVKMSAGITAKIGRFLFSASARKILGVEKSTIDFDEIISSGKILICNFSKGLLGEDTSSLFGTTILAKLQIAALRRVKIDQDQRTPYYLYVDEFQNFATMSFVQMLSEARKYRLFLIMAEQSTAQQAQQRLVDIILSNVGTIISFRSGSPKDESYILPLFSPYIGRGEIANLPSFNFYMRLSAVNSQEPLSGQTVLLRDIYKFSVAKEVIKASRLAYSNSIASSTVKDVIKNMDNDNSENKKITPRSKRRNSYE